MTTAASINKEGPAQQLHSTQLCQHVIYRINTRVDITTGGNKTGAPGRLTYAPQNSKYHQAERSLLLFRGLHGAILSLLTFPTTSV